MSGLKMSKNLQQMQESNENAQNIQGYLDSIISPSHRWEEGYKVIGGGRTLVSMKKLEDMIRNGVIITSAQSLGESGLIEVEYEEVIEVGRAR